MQNYNICFSLDSKYTEQFCVSAVSILKNANADDNINFYILDGGLTENDKTNIELLKNIKDFSIEYLQINEKDFKDCPMLKEKSDEHKDYHVTLPTYFRFKLPELLPKLDKVLYLDCDVIVRTSLKELFAVSLKDKAVAMVEDVESKRESERLAIKKYFNAGVMLINLDYWRKNNVSTLLFEYAKNNKKKILWQDQDVINAVLEGKIKSISLKWNYQYFLYNKINEQDLVECSILHLAGRFKPWLIPFEHFIYECYYYFLALTPFKNRIMNYKQKARGKFLKNDIGGTETNILLQVSNEDVQKLYGEINKNYDYVNKISSETTSKLELINKDIVTTFESVNSVTDVKISKVYEEITKNYEYTNELVDGIKVEKESLQADIDTKVAQSAEEVTVATDEKITKVYEEITKNYEYTNELRDSSKIELDKKVLELKKSFEADNDALRTEIGDKEYVFNEKILNLEKNIHNEAEENIQLIKKEITTLYEKIALNDEIWRKDFNELKEIFLKKLDEKVASLISQLDNKVSSIYDDMGVLRSDIETLIKQKAFELLTQTDEKIGKVYDEISKNYDYTNKLAQENKDLTYSVKSELEQQLKNAQENIYSYVDHSSEIVASVADEKIKNVENKITKNIAEFEAVQNRKNDLKISEVYAYANSELSKVFKQVHQNSVNFENKLELKSYETYKNIEEDRREIGSIKQSLENKTDFSDFNKLEEEFAEKLQMLDAQHQEQISKLVSDFENKLNEQRIKYETKLMNMENHVAVLEQKYIDSKKGFFTKVIEKCKKR